MKERFFTKAELASKAIDEICKRHFDGAFLSDIDSDWDWNYVTNRNFPSNAIGVCLRFKNDCYAVSFKELGYEPVFDNPHMNINGYKKIEENV